MTEIEAQVLESYKMNLLAEDGITPALTDALADELSKENPNSERLANIMRSNKKADSND